MIIMLMMILTQAQYNVNDDLNDDFVKDVFDFNVSDNLYDNFDSDVNDDLNDNFDSNVNDDLNDKRVLSAEPSLPRGRTAHLSEEGDRPPASLLSSSSSPIVTVIFGIITIGIMVTQHIPTMTKSHHCGELSVMMKVGMFQCQKPTTPYTMMNHFLEYIYIR